MRSRLLALLAALVFIPSLAAAQAPDWPALQSQLARDRVRPGSALER